MKKDNVAIIFANNITALRKQQGLSQHELAKKTGISQRMISHYETEGMIPSSDRFQALSTALDVPVSFFFETKTTKKKPTIDMSGIDPRSVKRLKDILSLPAHERNELYNILNKMLRKNKLKKH
jgi:transcriptional regulator with XRE-family HTH domain